MFFKSERGTEGESEDKNKREDGEHGETQRREEVVKEENYRRMKTTQGGEMIKKRTET